MAKQTKKNSEEKPKRRQSAVSLEDQENRCVALALNIAEQQLQDGTASAQVISHFLRIGSTKQILENENTKKEIELKGAKIGSIQSAQRSEDLYANAIKAMKKYRGDADIPDDTVLQGSNGAINN